MWSLASLAPPSLLLRGMTMWLCWGRAVLATSSCTPVLVSSTNTRDVSGSSRTTEYGISGPRQFYKVEWIREKSWSIIDDTCMKAWPATDIMDWEKEQLRLVLLLLKRVEQVRHSQPPEPESETLYRCLSPGAEGEVAVKYLEILWSVSYLS